MSTKDKEKELSILIGKIIRSQRKRAAEEKREQRKYKTTKKQ